MVVKLGVPSIGPYLGHSVGTFDKMRTIIFLKGHLEGDRADQSENPRFLCCRFCDAI